MINAGIVLTGIGTLLSLICIFGLLKRIEALEEKIKRMSL